MDRVLFTCGLYSLQRDPCTTLQYVPESNTWQVGIYSWAQSWSLFGEERLSRVFFLITQFFSKTCCWWELWVMWNVCSWLKISVFKVLENKSSDWRLKDSLMKSRLFMWQTMRLPSARHHSPVCMFSSCLPLKPVPTLTWQMQRLIEHEKSKDGGTTTCYRLLWSSLMKKIQPNCPFVSLATISPKLICIKFDKVGVFVIDVF